MEAIDDYANENIVRSVAYTALDHRQQHHYLGLLPISSQLLRQRVRLLGPSDNNPEEWDKVVQWQEDNCPSMIESLWSNQGSVADELYQKPVYYKRMDADTLHAIIEFAEKDSHHFVVILLLEDGSGDISDIKYYNTKELTEEEWLDIFTNWSRTIEDAERIFLTKVTRNKKTFTAGTPDSTKESKEAPEDYWGDWSSDEGSCRSQKSGNPRRPHPLSADLRDSDDSEDEYYTRWSKDPGTLTPGPGDAEEEGPSQPRTSGRILQPLSALTDERNQEEIDEEYDQSYNPLFTVPSVPNLMDAHTAALSELTQMLQTSLPQHRSNNASRPFVQPMTQINPLPKAVSRLRSGIEDVSIGEEEDDSSNAHDPNNNKFPGAYPESGTQSPARKSSTTQQVNKEAGRGLFMKSLSALIGAARLLGYEGKDILEMVEEIVNRS
ncbi:hypothetical protein V8B55DRAFT_1378545 [Mucor lusitanicus]|uniref:Uncharacterized protein n=2 Tax=Mucor circinelloides f. lusitanicus TaxID=29924 RepID=A0A168I2A7_MUCCL|nr:hypothetical protein FB192DRAFT_1436622 [Mucor lusitanicus]OAC99462.1 hypothetical protein MUCCIDRAFT_157220 [Mucor lusitanicus CBS 277.49]